MFQALLMLATTEKKQKKTSYNTYSQENEGNDCVANTKIKQNGIVVIRRRKNGTNAALKRFLSSKVHLQLLIKRSETFY